jgi:hypothetical protein
LDALIHPVRLRQLEIVMKKHALALVPFLFASPVLAAPATQEGADHLTSVFQTYLGATADVISVKPNGDVYDLTLDATPLIAMGKASGLTGTVTPIEMTLTDNGDATWGVSMDQAISIALAMPNSFDMKEDVASQKLEGTFDESLMYFSKLKGEFSGVKVTETIQAPNAPPTPVEITLEKGTVEVAGAAGTSGGVDLTATLSATGLTQTMTAPMAEGQPAAPIKISAEALSEDIKGTGVMFDGIYKLGAWFAAHPDQASKDADKAGLKTILTAGMPFFTNLTGAGKVTKVSVDSPIGTVGLDEVGFSVDVNGAVADGKFREALSISGLTLPAGLVPAWAAPILPKKVSLDVQVTDFDAAAGLTAALGALDMPASGMTDMTEFNAKVQSAFLPKSTVTITLNPGSLSGDGYELTYEGAMVAGPSTTIPTGTAKLTLTGADKLQAAINGKLTPPKPVRSW